MSGDTMKKRMHVSMIFISLVLCFTLVPSQSAVSEGRIAFASLGENWDIYVMDADGSHLTQITTLPSNEIHPAWSPYGNRIAVVSDKEGNNDIYLMNADGSGMQQLTTHPASDERPAWSPDGEKIVFISTRDGSDELYLTDIQGTDITRLTFNEWIDGYPCWTPDGSSIVFSRDVEGNTDIYVLDVATGIETNLTDNPARDSFPAVSPTGDIAFLSNRENPDFPFYHVYVMHADGSGVEKISEDHVMWECPAWSPRGTSIACVASTDIKGESTTDIYVLSADGSSMINLTQSPTFVDDPSWCCLKDPAEGVDSVLRKAQEAFDRGEFETAYDLALQAQSIAGPDESLADLIEKYESVLSASNQLGTAQAFMDMGENEKALGLLYGARMIFQQYWLTEKVAEIDALLADIEQQKQVEDTLLSAQSLFQKGKQAYETGEYEAALDFFQQAQTLFASIDSEKAQECEEWIQKTQQQLESGTCLGSLFIVFLCLSGLLSRKIM